MKKFKTIRAETIIYHCGHNGYQIRNKWIFFGGSLYQLTLGPIDPLVFQEKNEILKIDQKNTTENTILNFKITFIIWKPVVKFAT